MVDFRDMNKEPAAPKNKPNVRKPKVSFTELTAGIKKDNPENQPPVETGKILYQEASEYLNHVFEAVKTGKSFSLTPGFKVMGKMVDIQPFQDILFIMAMHLDQQYQFMINHSVNLAVFAIKMGANLGFTKQQQVEIGMAALLHDVGMAVIPDHIINKKERLTPQELKVFKERPKNGYNILKVCSEKYPYLPECAIQVHERIDGSGYPHGLKDDDIHEYAQIIGLLDMYEALIHSRPQREKLLHFSAVKEIIKNYKNSFQRKHLKVLLDIFSIFPIYSYVRLNSEAIGRVIETYPDRPMRPKLQIIYDSQKKKVLTERIVNLVENPLLYIVDSISEDDLESII